MNLDLDLDFFKFSFFFFSCSTKLNYDPYETVIDLVIDLGLMCSGMFYCPLLPIIICSKLCFGKIKKKNLIFNFTTFLFEKILCNLKFHAFFQAMRWECFIYGLTVQVFSFSWNQFNDYVFREIKMVLFSASRDIHSPSSIRFLFIAFSSVMVLFSSVMFIFAMVWNRSSDDCGPFADFNYAIGKKDWKFNFFSVFIDPMLYITCPFS